MYFEQDRDLQSQIIFRKNYAGVEEKSDNYNTNHLKYNTTNAPGEHIINSRTVNNGNKGRNYMEQNYCHTYLKCSKSEEYEFKFGKYENENFSSNCTTQRENERISFESVKIENLSSNISITVNYENRQEKFPNEMCSQTQQEYGSHKHLTKMKFDERNICPMRENERELTKNYNKNILENGNRTSTISNNNVKSNNILFSAVPIDEEIIRNNMHNNLFANSGNINDRNNINYRNNISRTTNNHLNKKSDINFCNDSNIIYNEDNNNGYKIGNFSKSGSDSLCNVNAIIKSENFGEYPVSTPQYHNEFNKSFSRNLKGTDYERIPIIQSPSNACLDSLYAKYPDISFNLPDCKVQKIRHCTDSTANINFDNNLVNNNHFLPAPLDNSLVTISPKARRNNTNYHPQNFNLKSEVNINKMINENEIKMHEHDIKVNSKVILPNPNFCPDPKITLKNQYEASNSLLYDYNQNNSNVYKMYDACSNNCFQKQEIQESKKNVNNYNDNIVCIKSDLENNVEIKPHIINKTFSSNCKKINHISIRTNSPKLDVKFRERQYNSKNPCIGSYKSNCGVNDVLINENLKNFATDHRLNQESVKYNKDIYENPSLYRPFSSTSTLIPNPPPSIVTSSKDNDQLNIMKSSNPVRQYESNSIESSANSREAFLSNAIKAEQNSLKYTIQWNEDPSKVSNPENINFVKNNESNARYNSKLLKRGEKISDTPNYRELLNKAYALKNAMSEKDLNLEIIRRTLKCDVPLTRPISGNSNPNFQIYKEDNSIRPRDIKLSYFLDGQNCNKEVSKNVSSKIKNKQSIKKPISKIEPASSSTLSKTQINKSSTKIGNYDEPILALSGYSPLDLSVKSIKTIADSTDGVVYSNCNSFPMLPKIDFHPNFSIASVTSVSKKVDKDVLDLSESKVSNIKQINDLNSQLHCSNINSSGIKINSSDIKYPISNINSSGNVDFNVELNNEFKRKDKSSKYLSTLINEPMLDNVKFSKILDDKAVDLTTKNELIKTLTEEARNSLKTNINLPNDNLNVISDAPIISQVPKIEKNDLELDLEEKLFNNTIVKVEMLATSSESVDVSFSNSQSKPKPLLKVNSQIRNCNNLDNSQSSSFRLVKLDNGDKNILKSENSKFKTEEKNEDVPENTNDIDSSRIRTKAELKGFDLITLQSNKNIKNERTAVQPSIVENSINSESTNENELNLMDWNSKCNDFVTQLACNSTKKPYKNNKIEISLKQTKDFHNGNRKFTKGKSKDKLNISNNILGKKLSSSSDDDKPLNELCEQNTKNFILPNSENKAIKIEDCLNELKTLNNITIENKLSSKQQSIIEKERISNDLEEEKERKITKSNRKSYTRLNDNNLKEVSNQTTGKVSNFDSNKMGFFDIKTRKRKFDSFLTMSKKEENESLNLFKDTSNCKNSSTTKGELKQNYTEILRKKICLESVSDNSESKVNTTILNKEKESVRDKVPRSGQSSNKRTKLMNNKECPRSKKRKILLRNIEFNRILRNKKMITRGNLKKSLRSPSNRNKNLLKEKNKNKQVNTSKKFGEIKIKKNQKRITRASTKNADTIRSSPKIEVKDTKPYKGKNNFQCNKTNLPINKNNTSKFPPGWEHEVFEYKKSLKVPLRLITIKGKPNTLLISEEQKSTTDSKINRIKKVEDDQLKNSNSQNSSSPSIIDILHSRAINLTKDSKRVSKNSTHNRTKSEKNYFNKSRNENSKKSTVNHFSVFDTEILKARTRTESRLLKTKEHIREIFVGEERPASAPPEMSVTEIKTEGNKTSFEEKFKQYLEEMNADFGAKIRKFNSNSKRKSNETYSNKESTQYDQNLIKDDSSHHSKMEKKDDIFELEDVEEYVVPESLKFDETRLVRSKMFKQKRPNKYRKKGSSGFDYIKKKKKLTTPKTTNFFIRRKMFPKFFGKKTENDVCKEIKNWVINKSLGQSYLHKAARLGYLDVIAYCLERLNMNPNPKDNAGYTPLHEACQQGRIDIARLLLQYGANHSQTAHSGIRPLHEASEIGYIEIIRLLLSYGADPLITTYAGQTPLMLAESSETQKFILNHIEDIQSSPTKKPWIMPGPWKKFDADEIGYNELDDAPDCIINHLTKNKSSLYRSLKMNLLETINSTLDKKKSKNATIRELVTNQSCDDLEDQFECEESECPLPPLYMLKDEGCEKWLLLNDLCHMLKIKSKETLLKQIVSSTSSTIGTKELLRELKISDFIEKATCLQLICAGEKLNIQASKVVLIKYNDQVKSLIGVEKTILNLK